MKHIRLFLSVLFLILMFVPVHAQNIDTKVYYRLTVQYSEDAPGSLSIFEFQKGNYAPNVKKLSTDVSQLWRFVDVGKGYFRLINASQPSMSLALNTDKTKKRDLVLANSKDALDQHWKLSPLKFSPENDGFRLSNRSQAGKCIDVTIEENPRVVLGKPERSSNQLWMLNKTDIEIGKVADYVKETNELRKIDPKVYYRLIIESDWRLSPLKRKLALDIYSSSNQGDYAPTTKELSTDTSQLWRFVDEGEGFFSLINASQPDMCLDVINDSNAYRVVLNKTGGGTGQLWKLSPDGLGFMLTNHWQKGNALWVDLDSNSVDFGSLTLNNGPGVIWMLQKTKTRVEGKTEVPVGGKFELTSTSFVNGAEIPFKYTGKDGVSPPLAWKGAPAGTKSFMILCTDPDAPSPANPDPNPFVHWFMLNIPADTKYLLAGIPRLQQVSTPFGAVQLINGTGEIGYIGPMPPANSGKHRYFFTILAMDRVHVIDPNLTIEEFMKILDSSVLGKAELMGTYEVTGNSVASRSSFRAIMDEIVRLSNIERANQGVPPLKMDSRLESAATAHSEEMARLTYFSHTSPTPGRETPEQRIRQAGAVAQTTAENIASFTSYPEATLAQEAVKGWMESPGHRQNLLNPNYTHFGIGVSLKGGQYYLTQKFCAF